MKSIFYTLTLVLAATAGLSASADAQTPFKQAPLKLPGGEFRWPMTAYHLRDGMIQAPADRFRLQEGQLPLVTRKDRARVLFQAVKKGSVNTPPAKV
jgi:hypothetical protein